MEFVGKRLVLRYESGLQVAGFYESPNRLTWEALSGSSKGSTGTETIAVKQLAPRLYFVNWVEKSGTTVSQVLDFNSAKVTSFVTFAAGTERQSILDTGIIEVQPQ